MPIQEEVRGSLCKLPPSPSPPGEEGVHMSPQLALRYFALVPKERSSPDWAPTWPQMGRGRRFCLLTASSLEPTIKIGRASCRERV